MPTLALLARKGGAGKTTLAVHLAVLAGKGALLVDTDPQRSAQGWAASRDRADPTTAIAEAGDLRRFLPRITASWVIVDTPPHVGGVVDELAELADLVLIPVRPSILDLRAIASTVAAVKGSRAAASIVLNACPPGRGVAEAGVVAEARKVLRGYGLPVCPVAIGQRASLTHALNDGRAVEEFEPAGKAAGEIRRLWKHVKTATRERQAQPLAS